LRKRIPILAYHAILNGAARELPAEWSRPHAVAYSSFREQLNFLRGRGWLSVGLDAVCAQPNELPSKPIAFTFDDGHSSDLIAADTLAEFGFSGTFFIAWSYIGRKHYVDQAAVKELVRGGFTIGSHAMRHAPLTEVDARELVRELVESKRRLEELTGDPVKELAVPFGRYDRRVIAAAMAAGYERVATSDIGIARNGTRRTLPRLPVTAKTSFADFCMLLTAPQVSLIALRLRNGLARRLTKMKCVLVSAPQTIELKD
jgi:peptidoglycan/xylan/chitin deacetylase (PgdA/CDA1 family)